MENPDKYKEADCSPSNAVHLNANMRPAGSYNTIRFYLLLIIRYIDDIAGIFNSVTVLKIKS